MDTETQTNCVHVFSHNKSKIQLAVNLTAETTCISEATSCLIIKSTEYPFFPPNIKYTSSSIQILSHDFLKLQANVKNQWLSEGLWQRVASFPQTTLGKAYGLSYSSWNTTF